MSDAATDQGWGFQPRNRIEELRAELASDEIPVSDVEGLELVERVRRRIETARRGIPTNSSNGTNRGEHDATD